MRIQSLIRSSHALLHFISYCKFRGPFLIAFSRWLFLFAITLTITIMKFETAAAQAVPVDQLEDAEERNLARETIDEYRAKKGFDFTNQVQLDIEPNMQQSLYSAPGFTTDADCSKSKTPPKKRKSKTAERLPPPSFICNELAQLTNETPLRMTGQFRFAIQKDVDGDDVVVPFSEVEIENKLGNGEVQKTIGWIPHDLITYNNPISSYTRSAASKIASKVSSAWDSFGEWCKPSQIKPKAPMTTTPNMKDIEAIAKKQAADEEILKNSKRKTASYIAEALGPEIGKCMLNPPDKPPRLFTNEIPYDEFALPTMLKSKAPKGLKKPDGKEITTEEMIEIDSLARTIFAEMASCEPFGAQYPMAVARIIKNRGKAVEENPKKAGEFIPLNDKHDSRKTLTSRAATSPVQFSCWNQKIIDNVALAEGVEEKAEELYPAQLDFMQKLNLKAKKKMNKKTMENRAMANARQLAKKEIRPNAKTGAFYKPNDSGLLHSLCPPSDPKQPFYDNRVPDSKMTTIWNSILKTSTEAVLFPVQFDERTEKLADVKHYTSGRSKFYNMVPVKASVDGRPINRFRCLNLWKPAPPKPAESAEPRKKSRRG